MTLPLNALKIMNIKKILIELLSYGEKTKLDLVLTSGLSNSTISDGINRLVKLNLVEVCGEGVSDGGRRPLIYRLNRNYGRFLGIAQNKDGFCVAVTDMCNNVVKYKRYEFDNTRHILDFYKIIHAILDELGKDCILSIGIGLDGIVDSGRGIVISDKSLSWDNVHLKELLERRFLIPVYTDNVINNVVQHEKLKGDALNLNNFICIFGEFPERVGIYLNDAVYRGNHFTAGKIKNVDSLIQHMKFIEEFLNLKIILYSCASLDVKALDTDNLNEKGGEKLVIVKNDLEIFAKSAALVAESGWFESSSFLTSGDGIE